MTANCRHCTAPSRDAFLCHHCRNELYMMLADLPWWIDRLAEAAVGHTQMSDGTGHGYKNRYQINGEHNVAHYLAPFPCNVDDIPDDKALNRRYAAARRQALAAGGVNDRASTLLDAVTNTLTTIVRGLCESRGIDWCPSATAGGLNASSGYTTARSCARWLRGQLGAISADEDAGQIYAEIHTLTGDHRHEGTIGKAINRPIPMRFLGRCPTWLEENRTACGVELWCRADAVEVFCKRCRNPHNPDRLQLLMVNDAEREKVTVERILELNRMLPEEYRISERTLRHWRRVGPNGEPPKLKPRGYIRAGDGREVITRHSEDDKPLYLWADVRRLRAEQWKVSAG